LGHESYLDHDCISAASVIKPDPLAVGRVEPKTQSFCMGDFADLFRWINCCHKLVE